MSTPPAWIEEAHLRVQDAYGLFERERYARTISTLYYAIHAVAKGVLLRRGVSVQRHAAVPRYLGLHFVRQGVLPNDTASRINELYVRRLDADYELQPFTQAETREWLDWTESIVAVLAQNG